MDAEPLGNDLPHQIACPQREVQLILRWVRAGDHREQHFHLRSGEFRWTSRNGLGPQRLRAAFSVRRDPPKNRRSVETEAGRDVLRPRPVLDLLARSNPDRFQRSVIKLSAIIIPHRRIKPQIGRQVHLLTISLVTGKSSLLCGAFG
jgi:hypothetical protein